MFRKISEWSSQRHAANERRRQEKALVLKSAGLRAAAQRGDLDRVQQIIHDCHTDLAVINHAKRAELHFKDASGAKVQVFVSTALHAAVYSGQVATMNALLSVDGIDVNAEAEDLHMRTPLLTAIVYGNKKAALVLAARPDVNPNHVVRFFQSEVALLTAVDYMPAVIPVLAARKDIDLGVTDAAHQTVLHLLCRQASDANLDCLHAVVKLDGAKLDARDLDNYTPLMRAAAAGRLRACRVLLERGADKDPRNNSGYNAMQIAELYGHSHVADMIRSYKSQAMKRQPSLWQEPVVNDTPALAMKPGLKI